MSAICPPLIPEYDPKKTYVTIVAFAMTPQSRGTVTLKSADPKDPPVCDPQFMAHPWDRKVMIDGTRQCYHLLQHPRLSKDAVKPLVAPKSDSDEDIWEFIQQASFLPNCHTVSTAYLIGETASERVISELGLDS